MAIIDTLKKIFSNYNGQTPSDGKQVEDAFNENFETVKQSVNSAYDEIAQLGRKQSGNLFSQPYGIQKANGETGSSSNFVHTEFIPITINSIIQIRAINSAAVSPCYFYDESKKPISDVGLGDTAGVFEFEINSGNIPANARYFIATGLVSDTYWIRFFSTGDVLRYANKFEERGLKKVTILGSTQTNCISYSEGKITIPADLVVVIEGVLYFKRSILQTLEIDTGRSHRILYNWANNEFYSEEATSLTTTYGNAGIYFVGFLRPSDGDFDVKTVFYNINGNIRLQAIYLHASTGNDSRGTIDQQTLTNKFYNENTQNRLTFFNAQNELTNAQNVSLNAVLMLNIYTPDIQSQDQYSLQRMYTTGTPLLAFYIKDIDGNKIGDTLYITPDDKVALSDKIWYAKKNFSNGASVEVIIDDNLITTNFSSTGIGFYVHRSRYIDAGGIISRKLYCNLGASTSGYPWHLKAVANLGAIWKTYNVGGSAWVCYIEGQLDYSSTPIAANRSMMNELARLFKDNDDNGYYPDSISIMCGLGDANVLSTGGYTLGSVDKALSVDLTNLSPTNWYTDAPTEWLRDVSINMMACLVWLSQRFPYAQIILMTCQATTNVNYPTDKIILVNKLIEDMAKRLAIPVIDFFGQCGISDVTRTTAIFLKSDNLHPNDDGDVLLANYAILKLKNILHYRR
jgi:hypothetical protein